MEYEIELKLLTNEHADEIIESQLLPTLKAKVTQRHLSLMNHYFDTSDRLLRRHDIGLRIRGNGNNFEQTLKTAGGSVGGLHTRPEYNVQLTDQVQRHFVHPKIDLFPINAWPEHFDLDTLQNQITTLFSTNFQRTQFLIEQSDSAIELVLDKGEIKAGDKKLPICEIELELKKGPIKGLFDLAKQLVNLVPITIGLDSKAARGYRLISSVSSEGEVEDNLQMPEYAESFNAPITLTKLLFRVEKQLSVFQQLSAKFRAHPSLEWRTEIAEILHSLSHDLDSMFNHHAQILPASLPGAVAKLVSDWGRIDEQSIVSDYQILLSRAETTAWQLDLTYFLIQQQN